MLLATRAGLRRLAPQRKRLRHRRPKTPPARVSRRHERAADRYGTWNRGSNPRRTPALISSRARLVPTWTPQRPANKGSRSETAWAWGLVLLRPSRTTAKRKQTKTGDNGKIFGAKRQIGT